MKHKLLQHITVVFDKNERWPVIARMHILKFMFFIAMVYQGTIVSAQSEYTYFISNHVSPLQFGSVDMNSRDHRVIADLPGVNTIINLTSTFDRKNKRFIFYSNLGITIVDAISGEILKTYEPDYNTCKNLEFSLQDQKLYYISFNGTDASLHALDIESDVRDTISVLSSFATFSTTSSTFDQANNRYIYLNDNGLAVVDPIDGSTLDFITSGATCLTLIEYNTPNNSIYYLYWNGTSEVLASIDLSTGINSDVGIVNGVNSLVNLTSTYDSVGQEHIFVSNLGLTSVDINNTSNIDDIQQLPFNYQLVEFDTDCNSSSMIDTIVCLAYRSPDMNDLYTTSGTYRDTIENAAGCDSIIIIDLVVLGFSDSVLNVQICSGDSFLVGTNTYTASGQFVDTLTSVFGCDSIVRTALNVRSQIFEARSDSICPGQMIFVGSSVYDSSGVYFDTLQAFFGCDSIIGTTISRLESVPISQSFTICQGDFIRVGNNMYSSPGDYMDTLSNQFGCDSILMSNVSFFPQTFISDTVNICAGEFYQVANSIYSVSGKYVDTLSGVNVCDTIINTYLTVFDTVSIIIEESLCTNDSVQIGSQLYREPGVYMHVLASENGCDSILNIVINATPASVCFEGACDAYIPSAFSPNNDGINDVFKIYSPNVVAQSIKIYSRWGNEYKTRSEWDGEFNSNRAETGIYIYNITAICNEILELNYTGELFLMR